MSREIVVSNALPYANGELHLGHLVGYMQADIWVRAQRMSGNTVHYVCADDTHGTPIMLGAEKAGKTPEAYIAGIKVRHELDFRDFGVHFDHYDSTHSAGNRTLTEGFYARLDNNGHVSRRSVAQLYDPVKGMFLPDRYVKGICPNCGTPDQYGDNCENCGATYAPTELKEPRSVVSGATPELRDSEHFFFEVGHFEAFLREWLAKDVGTPGIRAKLHEWLDAEGGLRAWDISRDAPYFGFEIPGHPGKYLYVWIDAPIGYLSSFQVLCEREGLDFWSYLARDSRAELHHFIGKDIVTFHGLFWPAVLHGAGFRAPTRLHVNGYLMVNSEKMSKSRGTFIQARTYLDVGLDPEALRYYFATKTSGGVEDIDLNLADFVARVNADVVGKFVNLASRCAGFIEKRFDGRLADALPDAAMYQRFVDQLIPIAQAYDRNEAATALRLTMALADEANKYIDEYKPWVLAKQDGADAQLQAVCTQGLNLFRVLAAALKPVLPRVAAQAEAFLQAPVAHWSDLAAPLIAHTIGAYTPLFTRIDTKLIENMIEASKESLAPSAPTADTAIKPAASAKAEAAKPAPAAKAEAGAAATIAIDDFAKLDLRVGKVLACEFVEGSDKLLRFELDAGDLGKRQIFSGIRGSYAEPSVLVGRSVVFIANLAPRKMRFGLSEGMILSAGFDGGDLFLLDADGGAAPGMPVR
ncbi:MULTISPECIES: methionine--tRNA ligase [unclassified Lysobacter]|uniref:methionine--tRNA ligase n=1 Tax=unclassified Lysobacter TaxID=2635362 RepID=UPI001BE6CB9E|nr:MULTISPECIES: methionine--tRNA ligase [unclassified Lysobacter]MBT2749180.1 methionine--tRNA ligase [Lysobacter sp. ISL-42]MBT2753932.1 methionine--tRNA ligase [Lysobacter sp. ISL-50]MBT2779590.1 methionine--tRNA ligase [Lysobacter sp. ISL-54]MBT2784514.1 methionine--tRNA ligase [Lysobacter sp. ISL-52]